VIIPARKELARIAVAEQPGVFPVFSGKYQQRKSPSNDSGSHFSRRMSNTLCWTGGTGHSRVGG
jgi:hypothetical protein